MTDTQELTGTMHDAIVAFAAEVIAKDPTKYTGGWSYRIDLALTDDPGTEPYVFQSDGGPSIRTPAELDRAAGKGTVDYSLLHGGFLPNIDLGIMQARRLDDLPPWHSVFDAVKAILLQYVSEHDADGVALRSAAQSIVLDAEGSEDELSPEARAVLDEARAVLGDG
jgi:hypothetical protein